jgi:hypothetical protein
MGHSFLDPRYQRSCCFEKNKKLHLCVSKKLGKNYGVANELFHKHVTF